MADTSQATNEFSNLIWYYKPPDDKSPEEMEKRYDFFILTKKDEEYRDALLALNPELEILQYLRFDAIHDPCGFVNLGERADCKCDSHNKNSNNVAWEADDLCDIVNNHPDWILHDTDGNFVASDTYVYMDPGNQEWREFWLSRAQYAQEELGWRGVYLDVVEGSLGKFERHGFQLANYSDDESFRIAVEGFLKYLSDTYFQPQDRPLFANILETREAEIWMRYAQHLDGVLDESWAVDWNDGYISEKRWLEEMDIAEAMRELGKTMIVVAQGEPDNINRHRFAYLSYLLIADEKTYFRFADGRRYNEVQFYDDMYDIELGRPTSKRYQISDTLWRRDFEKGYIEIDPVNITIFLALNTT